MSRPAPTPKQNFLQTALIMIVVFLGMRLFLGSNTPSAVEYSFQPGVKKELKSSEEVLEAIKDVSRRVESADPLNRIDPSEITRNLLPAYQRFLEEDVTKKKYEQKYANGLKYQAMIIAADAELRGGIVANNTGLIRQAYNSLEKIDRTNGQTPAWVTPFELPTGEKITGHELFTKLISTLSDRNKTDLIWGAIPGGFAFIDFLVKMTGAVPGFSYAFAGFLLAIVVRSIVFPLAQKQIMSSRQMSQLMPRIKEIKEKYADNQVEMNTKTMELYKEYGINPFSGCVPALIQLPLFLTVYQCMIHYQFEFTKGHFLWINEASSRATHGFLGANLGQQDYILVFIYGVSMCVTSLLTPVSDPTQVKQQRLMGIGMSLMFTVMMFTGMFPVVSGFVLYWIFTNLLATAQSLRAYRLPLPPLVKVNTPSGGVYPSGSKKASQGRWAQMMDQARQVAEEKANQAQQQQSQPGKKPLDPPNDGGTGTSAKHKPKKRN